MQGLTFIAKLGRKDHRAGVVGDYASAREEAVYAALRLKMQLLEAE